MPRAIHVFRTPDRFVAGTVGEPGDRTFFLQAVHDARVVSVALEKQQVQVLADRMGLLLEEVQRRFGTDVPTEEAETLDTSPLVTPIDTEFRVGTMGLVGTPTPMPSWWSCWPSVRSRSTNPSCSTTPTRAPTRFECF